MVPKPNILAFRLWSTFVIVSPCSPVLFDCTNVVSTLFSSCAVFNPISIEISQSIWKNHRPSTSDCTETSVQCDDVNDSLMNFLKINSDVYALAVSVEISKPSHLSLETASLYSNVQIWSKTEELLQMLPLRHVGYSFRLKYF